MVSLVLKVTEKCNSNCYYCGFHRKHRATTMDKEMLKVIFYRIDEFLQIFPDEKIELLWHGGEPLLLGPKYYWSILKLQDKYSSRTKTRISHSIQTNLTCLTEEFINVFRELGISAIGTSYDPEPHMRGPGKNIDSDKYNSRFMKAVGILEKHHIGWGVIYIVTKKSLTKPLNVFFFLTNLMPSGGISLNPVLIDDEENEDIAINYKEYVEFLGKIFSYWWNYRHRYLDIEPFSSLMESVAKNENKQNIKKKDNFIHNFINISTDGKTSQCRRATKDLPNYYGNIKERKLKDILQDHQEYQLFERDRKLKKQGCKDCRFWELCYGGLIVDSFSQNQKIMEKGEWCKARRAFIEDYFEPITGVYFEPKSR